MRLFAGLLVAGFLGAGYALGVLALRGVVEYIEVVTGGVF